MWYTWEEKAAITLIVLLIIMGFGLVGLLVWNYQHPCKRLEKSETCYVYSGNVAVPFECGKCLERE